MSFFFCFFFKSIYKQLLYKLSKFPNLSLIEHLWDMLDKEVRSMESPPHILKDFKDLLLTSWSQIPMHTSSGVHVDQHNIRQLVIMLCLIGVWSGGNGEHQKSKNRTLGKRTGQRGSWDQPTFQCKQAQLLVTVISDNNKRVCGYRYDFWCKDSEC